MNSENYNHLEIKQEIDPMHYIETQSDSAILGYLYKQYGQDEADIASLTRKLDGKFTFILYDEQK